MDFRFTMYDRQFVLIDTPGLGYSPNENMGVLGIIARRLSKNGSQEVGGVIFFHAITEGRFTGSTRHNIEIFKMICGERFFTRTVFLTTMWNNLDPQGQEKYNLLQRELERQQCQYLTANQSIKFDGDTNTVKAVVEYFARLDPTNPAQLLLAQEMEKLRLNSVRKTTAGRFIALQFNCALCVIQ